MTAKRQTHAIDQAPETTNREELAPRLPALPSVERIQHELASATTLNDFFGKDGLFARLFATTIEQMLEAELTAHLGYQSYAAEGRNSGNSRNGKRLRSLRTSAGDTTIAVPRDRNATFHTPLLEPYQSSTSELEDKIIGMYAKGVSARDIQETLKELYGVEVSATTISAVTDKVWSLVEVWQNRPLAAIYPIAYLDAIHLKLRRDGKVQTTAVYIVLAIDLEGQRHVLGHWVGDGAEGANFWLSVVTDLQSRGVQDIFLACVDGLTGFKEAITAVFPRTQLQRCIIHQVRSSLSYVSWKDRKIFARDLRTIYQAPTREAAESKLLEVSEKWSSSYPVALRGWETHWEDLATMFDYGAEIRRVIYTTNTIEGYNRQLRKVTKTKGSFPSAEAARKLLFLVTRDITRKWTMPPQDWARIRNQLAIRFAGRFPAD
jgi:transposase-like protein